MTPTAMIPWRSARVTEAGYAAMTAAVRHVGGELDAPVGIVLEGGYSLSALADSVLATLRAMQDPGDGHPVSGIVPEAAAARERLSQWWPALGSS